MISANLEVIWAMSAKMAVEEWHSVTNSLRFQIENSNAVGHQIECFIFHSHHNQINFNAKLREAIS